MSTKSKHETSESGEPMLCFGGDNLLDGSHTWYEDQSGALHTAYPGTVVPLSSVRNSGHYVTSGMATVKQ